MNIVVITGANGEMLFNHRRVSKDKAIIPNLKEILGRPPIYMSEYSYKAYPFDNAVVRDDFLAAAGEKDFCLAEEDLKEYENEIETLVHYRFDSIYPADLKLEIDFTKEPWEKLSEESFKGNSHDKITRFIYRRKVG